MLIFWAVPVFHRDALRPARRQCPPLTLAIKRAAVKKRAVERSPAAQDDVEAAAAAVAAMRAPDRGDPRRVARRREPVVDRGADSPALDRRLARPRVAGDQQQRPGRRPRSPARARGRSRARRCRDCGREGRRRGRLDRARAAAAGPSCRRACRPASAGRRSGGRGCGDAGLGGRRDGLRLRRLRRLGSALASGSRDSGRMVAVTRAHSSASSGLSERTRRGALGQQDQRLARGRHAAGDRASPSAPAPQKVSKRLAPLIAPPVSCATHRPLASGRSSVRKTGAPSGTNSGIGRDRRSRRHRHAERAERARPGQLPEEDVATDSRASAPGPRPGWRASRRRSPACSRRPAAGCRARAAAARWRHIRGRSDRHSRSASRRRRAAGRRPEPWIWRKNSSIGSAAQASSSPRPASAPSSISARVK